MVASFAEIKGKTDEDKNKDLQVVLTTIQQVFMDKGLSPSVEWWMRDREVRSVDLNLGKSSFAVEDSEKLPYEVKVELKNGLVRIFLKSSLRRSTPFEIKLKHILSEAGFDNVVFDENSHGTPNIQPVRIRV